MSIDLSSLSENQIALLKQNFSCGLTENELSEKLYIQTFDVNIDFLKEQLQAETLKSLADQIKNISLVAEEGQISLKYPKAFYQGLQAGLVGTTDYKKEE